MRTVVLLISPALSKLNASEYLNLMTRLRTLIETATPTALGLTDEEFEEELRLSEASGFVSHEEALKEFAKWGFVR